MNRLVVVLALIFFAGPVVPMVWTDATSSQAGRVVRPPARVAGAAPRDSAAPESPPAAAPFRMPGEDTLYLAAARTAWRYVETQTQPATGLVNSVRDYPYATVWDLASGLAALYCAGELGLVEAQEYDARMRRMLGALARLPLFDQGAFNKNYQVARGIAAGPNDRQSSPRRDGYGWSATDLGRLLVWLRIVAAAHPEYAELARTVANRIDFDRVVRDGYLWGEALRSGGRAWQYQEGRLGYEQYAAAGFALWDHNADGALNLGEHAREVEVYGVPVWVDRRGEGRLTSEPFLLMGMELGWWDSTWQVQARRVLAAQEARFQRTQRLTLVSEDALPLPPYYFYYYTVHDGEEPFAVRALGPRVPRPEPRWVSTKAAFAWYALMPGDYTWRAVQRVSGAAAHPQRGWSSGVYEGSGRSTGSENVNTAAVVLEAALYHTQRRPILVAAMADGAGSGRTPAAR